MQYEYSITLDGNDIGKVNVIPQGLYYDIRCTCKMQDGVLRIAANCGNRTENIGVCIPKEGKMVIHTRIPQKRLSGLIGFSANQKMREVWVPIKCGEPFPALYKIGEAKFAYQHGVPGLLVAESES